MREFHVEVLGGLCNRLRVFMSAGYLAQRYDRKLVLHWPSNDDCGARFGDLFTNIIAETDSPRANPPSWRETEQDKVVQAVRSSEPIVWVRECRWLVPKDDRPKTIPQFEALRPVDAVVERVTAVTERFQRPVMGVHVRRGDFAEYLPNQHHVDLPPLQRYFDYLDGWSGTIFLATDGGDAVEGKFHDRYGDNVVVHPKRCPGRNTLEAIQDALVDVYLLQACQAMIGTRFSSFSELAWAVSGVPRAKVTSRKANTLARLKFTGKLLVGRIRRTIVPGRSSPRWRKA